jgi:hypothetical protein
MNSLSRDTQIARNRESQDRWSAYASHRARLTELLREIGAGGKLLVLGAGNCNDLDLPQLLQHYKEIHLVDLDTEALVLGVKRQGLAPRSPIVLHGAVDVTGIADIGSTLSKSGPPKPDEIRHIVNMAFAHTLSNIGEPFDAAASIGLLSQIVEMALHSLSGNARALELMSAVRLRHLQLMLHAVKPGGGLLLVTEVVSSSTCAELARTSHEELPALLQRLVNDRNFFTGLNPAVLESLWQREPSLAPYVERVRLTAPWLWNFGPRVYACCAICGLRRKSGLDRSTEVT